MFRAIPSTMFRAGPRNMLSSRLRAARAPLAAMLSLGLAVLLVATTLALVTEATYAPADAAVADRKPGGRTHGHSGRLRDGCRKAYSYGYRVRAPSDDWSLEVSIINPKGRAVRADAFLGKPGPQGDRRHRKKVRFELCRNSNTRGVYKIRSKFIYYPKPTLADRFPEGRRIKVPVERFRLR